MLFQKEDQSVKKPKGDLTVYWSPRQNDVMFENQEGIPASSRRLLYHAFSVVKVHGDKSLLDELEQRGFDLHTLRFSIDKKPDSPQTKNEICGESNDKSAIS